MIIYRNKVKVKVKVKLTLEQAMRAQRGARWDRWSTPRSGRFTPGKKPKTVVQDAGWAPGSVWTGGKNLAATEIRSPDLQPVASRYTD